MLPFIRLFRCSGIIATALLTSVLWLSSTEHCLAQDDASSDPAVDLSPEQLESDVDAHVIQLNDKALRGNEHLADAIAGLVRVRRWSDADRHLTRGITPINNQAQLAALADRMGPEVILRILSHPTVSDAAKAAAAKLGKASRAESESATKIAAAIDDLDHPSVDQRLAAARTLLRGGDVALKLLVEAGVAESPSAPRDAILRTMLKLGGGGTQAIGQYTLYGQGAQRVNALQAYTRIDRELALPDLVTAIHAVDTTPTESAFARVNVMPLLSTQPSKQDAQAFLYSELIRLRRIATGTENSTQTTSLWTISQDRKSVLVQSTRSILLAYRDAVDASARLRRLGGLTPAMVDASLAADLSYRVMIDPDWGAPDQVKAIRGVYQDAVGATGLSHAIQVALKANDHPALVGLARMVSRDATVLERAVLLSSDSPNMTPLVRLVMHAEPRVRYEAAAAITRLNPPASYAGSSYVTRCLGEMQSLEDRPLAILVETRSEVSLRQESILSKLGYEVEVVGSVGDLERCIARGGDLRLVLSKTQLWDYPPVELIDRVRRMPHGKNLPIVFYGESAEGIESDRWDGISRLIERPKTPAAFGNLLIDLELLDRLPPMTTLDRREFREVASQFLATQSS